MTYTITITNKNICYDVRGVEVIDLSTISPSLITKPDVPYVEYQGDMSQENTSVYVPLYKRFQYVELKASSILVIQTEDSDEAIYYRNLVLGNVTILCDPDPISGESTNAVSALKDLYVALGGSEEDVQDVNSIVGVLNAISTMYGGETSNTISGAIEDIADVSGNIGGGSKFPFRRIITPSKYIANSQYKGEYYVNNDEDFLEVTSDDIYKTINMLNPINSITGLSDIRYESSGVDTTIRFIPGDYFVIPSDIEFTYSGSLTGITPGDNHIYTISIQYNSSQTNTTSYTVYRSKYIYEDDVKCLTKNGEFVCLKYMRTYIYNNKNGSTSNDTILYDIYDSSQGTYNILFINPVTSFAQTMEGNYFFTPSNNYYFNTIDYGVSLKGSTVTKGDGKLYMIERYIYNSSVTNYCTKSSSSFSVTVET